MVGEASIRPLPSSDPHIITPLGQSKFLHSNVSTFDSLVRNMSDLIQHLQSSSEDKDLNYITNWIFPSWLMVKSRAKQCQMTAMVPRDILSPTNSFSFLILQGILGEPLGSVYPKQIIPHVLGLFLFPPNAYISILSQYLFSSFCSQTQ